MKSAIWFTVLGKAQGSKESEKSNEDIKKLEKKGIPFFGSGPGQQAWFCSSSGIYKPVNRLLKPHSSSLLFYLKDNQLNSFETVSYLT